MFLSVPFRRPFGEGPVVPEHAPSHKGKAASYDHKGVVVLVALLAETAIDAMEIRVLVIDREGGQVQGLAQVGGAPLADVGSRAAHFSGLEGVLRGATPKPEDKVSEAQMVFDGFDWGGPELEKRIIKRFNQRCEETLRDAETATDPARQVIYAEATKLLCKLQHALLAEPRFREILAQMKP